MTKRMLIDSTHAEETRVVVLDGNRLEDYDVETSTKQQLKGNIYLAKVVRVEPSLQAAFVEYGGNRHGFLAFGEIHPDYYQIPVADRQRLLEMQEAEAREDEEAEDRAAARDAGRDRAPEQAAPLPLTNEGIAAAGSDDTGPDDTGIDIMDAIAGASYVDPDGALDAIPELQADPSRVAQAAAMSQDILVAPHEAETLFPDEPHSDSPVSEFPGDPESSVNEPGPDMVAERPDAIAGSEPGPVAGDAPFGDVGPDASEPGAGLDDGTSAVDAEHTGPEPEGYEALETDQLAPGFDDAEPPPESVGGDAEEPREQRAPPRFLRNYKIQEVIRRRQILLIQVVKEERGTKGAALTTYVSLAGRFSVLMPNSPRGGGISRKITSAADRRRLKEVTAELDLPRGMGLIVRTAGANRPKPEIIRDCEYLLNQWDQIRDLTMKSVAPALIYEEASLIKRAIRDLYSRDVDDILVDGEEGWRAARDFMRMLMPTHAKKVQLWRDPQPLFVKAQVEAQLDAMLMPTVQLKSGGYLVINQTEALVAIDVNSGRSTRERGIEETALKTNLEAADEAARQLRLRDLAGLIVIDFIDMESRRNNAAVEKRLKDALKTDRARIQIGSISHFGLLEMSRQRLRPSLSETSFVTCPHCTGTGQIRSTESAALHVLRGVEEEGAKRRAAEIVVHVAGPIALYVLNNKRVRLAEVETRYGMRVAFAADDSLLPPDMRIERVRAAAASEAPAPISQLAPPEPFEDPDEEPMDTSGEATAAEPALSDSDDEDAPRPGETVAEAEQRRGPRRRRRRGGRREEGGADAVPASEATGPSKAVSPEVMNGLTTEATDDDAPVPEPADGAEAATAEDGERGKRRGRRGGRRRRREPGDVSGTEPGAENQAEPDDGAGPAAAGSTPAYVPPPYVPLVPAYTPPASSPPPYTPPPYAGPTPANPFGGTSAFDIFDAIEQAEQERALAATERRAAEPAPVTPPAPVPAIESEPVIPEPVMLQPDSVSLGEPDAPATEPTQPAAPAPEAALPAPAETRPVLAEPADAATVSATPARAEPDAPAAAPLIGPAIQPVLIVDTEAPAEKRRGWWSR